MTANSSLLLRYYARVKKKKIIHCPIHFVWVIKCMSLLLCRSNIIGILWIFVAGSRYLLFTINLKLLFIEFQYVDC